MEETAIRVSEEGGRRQERDGTHQIEHARCYGAGLHARGDVVVDRWLGHRRDFGHWPTAMRDPYHCPARGSKTVDKVFIATVEASPSGLEPPPGAYVSVLFAGGGGGSIFTDDRGTDSRRW